MKKLHLNNIVYKVLYPFFHQLLDVNEDTVKDARVFLESISKNPNNSSVCSNFVQDDPDYDLLVVVPAYNVDNILKNV